MPQTLHYSVKTKVVIVNYTSEESRFEREFRRTSKDSKSSSVSMGNTSRYSSRARDESSVAEEAKSKSMFTRTDANKSWTSRMEALTWSAMLLKFGGKSS